MAADLARALALTWSNPPPSRFRFYALGSESEKAWSVLSRAASTATDMSIIFFRSACVSSDDSARRPGFRWRPVTCVL